MFRAIDHRIIAGLNNFEPNPRDTILVPLVSGCHSFNRLGLHYIALIFTARQMETSVICRSPGDAVP